MKPSTILFIVAQITVALSLKIGGPDVSEPPDDGRGTIPATELGTGNRLFARDCWFGVPYGCSQEKKRCWRTCGSAGEWCWLAADGGSGPWLSCTRDSQCSPQATPGTGCGKGDCGECGCSC